MITERQRLKRYEGIGSSDTPAILGISPFARNAADVWLEKVHRIERESTPQMKLGQMLEGVILDEAAKRFGFKIRKNQFRRHPSEPLMFANLDAITQDGKIVIEAKLSGQREHWGPNNGGPDDIRADVLAQVQHQMECVPTAEQAIVAVLLLSGPSAEMRFYDVPRNQALGTRIREFDVDFWKRYVEPKVRPPAVVPHRDLLSMLERVEGKTVAVPEDLFVSACFLRQQRLDIQKAEKRALDALIDALGDAEVGECRYGRIEYKLRRRKEYTVQASEYRQAALKADKEAISQALEELACGGQVAELQHKSMTT